MLRSKLTEENHVFLACTKRARRAHPSFSSLDCGADQSYPSRTASFERLSRARSCFSLVILKSLFSSCFREAWRSYSRISRVSAQ